MIKSIGYAYASSTYAARLGRAKSGCYYVETMTREFATRPKSLDGPFATKLEAETFANGIDAEWSRYTMRAAS
jgi:hypothetical protein